MLLGFQKNKRNLGEKWNDLIKSGLQPSTLYIVFGWKENRKKWNIVSYFGVYNSKRNGIVKFIPFLPLIL